jgi:hypothetical protein
MAAILDPSVARAARASRFTVSAGRSNTRVTDTRARTDAIESHSQMRSATGGQREAAPGAEPRGDCRGDPHNDESAMVMSA